MHGNNKILTTQPLNVPSSILQIYNHLHSHPSMVLKSIKEDYVKPTVFEKIYKSILKKKTMMRHIRRTALYPYRKLYGFDTCSVMSNQSRSSCGSTRSAFSSRSTSAPSSRRTSSDLSFSRRSSANSTYYATPLYSARSHSSQPLSPREIYDECFLLENIYTKENTVEKIMFMFALLQTGDIKQLRANIKISSKKVIGVLIFIIIVLCCQSSIRVIPSDNTLLSAGMRTVDIQSYQTDMSAEASEMKTMLMGDSGIALNIPYAKMSINHKKSAFVAIDMADMLSNNLDTTSSSFVSSAAATEAADTAMMPTAETTVTEISKVVEILSDNIY